MPTQRSRSARGRGSAKGGGGKPRGAKPAATRDALDAYRAKRRFDVTPEPSGGAPARTAARAKPLGYVVHKHRASHLHYDLRLAWDGVLLSWAVPKGPSLDPSVKRLAVRTEDHPIEYDSFEGVIPEREYGAGTMMIWDRGVWAPESPDVGRDLARGELKFRLEGEKLHGSFVLVRTRGPGGDDRDGRSWLLIKHRDEGATGEDVTETQPRSVASGRLLAEIAFDEGGDPVKAATGDPEHAVRELLDRLARERAAASATGAARKRPTLASGGATGAARRRRAGGQGGR
jgi:bifunctional non-homologous end joining protein LigD